MAALAAAEELAARPAHPESTVTACTVASVAKALHERRFCLRRSAETRAKRHKPIHPPGSTLADAAVVLLLLSEMVRVELTGAPARVTMLGDKLQVGKVAAVMLSAGVTEQLRVTSPEKPCTGESVTRSVLPLATSERFV
jgi:hypothetical protein